MRAFFILLLLSCSLHGAGLGVYNPAQHAVNGFMPTQLPGLSMWLDSSRQGYTNNTSVERWSDFSGTLRHATNATLSQCPTFIASSINGRAAIRFDGTDDWLSTHAAALQSSGVGYVALIAQQRTTNASYQTLLAQYALSQQGRSIFVYNQGENGDAKTNNFNMFLHGSKDGNGIYGYAIEITNSPPNVLTLFSGKAGSEQSRIYSKGAIHETFTVTNVLQTNVTIGYAFGLGYYANFDFLEIVVGNGVLSDYQNSQIQRYLGTKYGIVVK